MSTKMCFGQFKPPFSVKAACGHLSLQDSEGDEFAGSDDLPGHSEKLDALCIRLNAIASTTKDTKVGTNGNRRRKARGSTKRSKSASKRRQ
jgi:hypothetical protein